MPNSTAVVTALAGAPFELEFKLVLRVDVQAPFERVCEEFCNPRTRLEQLQSDRAAQEVLIASPSQGEGKSFAAENLRPGQGAAG